MKDNVVRDRLNEFIDRAENSTTKLAFGDVAKETFDHVEPGSAGRREMNVETVVAFHPCLDLRMFVRGVVIANDVNLFIRRRITFDQVQEPNPFLMTMSGHTGFQHRSIQRVKRCKESRRTV